MDLPTVPYTVPVPSDQYGHDHAAVAQNGEENDDGKVDDPALLAFLHAGALPSQLSEKVLIKVFWDRVTTQVDSNLTLTSEQKFCFGMRPIY